MVDISYSRELEEPVYSNYALKNRPLLEQCAMTSCLSVVELHQERRHLDFYLRLNQVNPR
jgi:hypothetical protein